ncbi:hypothetical protein B0A49_09775 [Cryomyces minteri]|uniref:Uncharacterized protein n=1 Tax=Cryomyces minteri TaxID=331657 RepID=A0A4U0XD65_9PEZI|nr:hypothetical protein B0A49_09775 [Cryomyces minteri]
MTRTLQNRLALANVKIKHGWEDLSIDIIEPQIEQQLRRKRPASTTDTVSDTSSSISDRYHLAVGYGSSLLMAPMFSDELERSRSSQHHHKRVKYQPTFKHPTSSSHTRNKVRTSIGSTSEWKSAYRLPESSTIYHNRHAHFATSHVPHLSFISEGSTVADETMSPIHSEDDDDDLPVSSFQLSSAQIHSSPPRTATPGVARSSRLRQGSANVPMSRTPKTGRDGADLLVYFGASPSPIRPTTTGRMEAPSTPLSKHTPLQSCIMTTPGDGGGGSFFGLNTPQTNFNFADFVNVTPSPAQGAWTRTPATAKTPMAVREARRGLNFDSLLPPGPTSGSSPSMSNFGKSPDGKGKRSSMEFGGELVS